MALWRGGKHEALMRLISKIKHLVNHLEVRSNTCVHTGAACNAVSRLIIDWPHWLFH